MSISIEEWSAGRADIGLEGRIFYFLKQGNKAFSIIGIMRGLGYNTETEDSEAMLFSFANLLEVKNALGNLLNRGAVEAKIIAQPGGQQLYYRASDKKFVAGNL